MLGLAAAKAFSLAYYQYFIPISFFNNYGAAIADRYKPLDVKSFQNLHEANGTVHEPTPVQNGEQCLEGIVEQYEKVIRAPVDYLLSIPGKDVRGKPISAFNEWLKIPDDTLVIVNDIIGSLHTASLLIDDIQDDSRLRRGRPVAHSIFGIAQTIDAANYAYFLQQERLSQLDDPRGFQIFTRELLNLHRGQGMDLYWRDSLVCPTEEEYTEMVIHKTGGLFRLAVELMQIRSKVTTDFSKLISLLGVIFQIRDDYLNLQSGLYAEKKGSMEVLTEGKFSYPIIHSVRSDPKNTQLLNILKQRSEDIIIKTYAVQYMESTGSFQHCRDVLRALMEQARHHVHELERSLGPNKGIHAILDLLELPQSSKDSST